MKTLVRSVSGAMFAFAMLALFSHAATADSTVEGTITAISGTTLPAVLTVQSGVTSYTVNVTSSTTLVRNFNGPSTLEEFAIGDLVVVEGTLTGTTIDATKIKNLSIQRKGSLFWGTILSIDSTNKTLVLDPKHRKNLPDQTVITTSATKFFQGNRAGDFDDLAVGMNVRIVGLWRKSLSKITADRILIKLTQINGTVSAIDCTAKTMTMLRNKGKSSEQSWTVAIKDDTVIRDKQLNIIACNDVKAGHRVHVRGLRTGELTMNALQIWDRGAKKTQNTWNGEITAIDSTNKTFELKVKGKKNSSTTYTVATVAETIIVNDNGIAIAFTDLLVGHDVQVKGTLSGTTITGNLIIDKDLP